MKVFAIAAALAALLCGAAEAAPVKMLKIEKETTSYDLSIEYPQMGVKAIDDDIAAWARAQADQFLRHVRQKPHDDSQWAYAVTAKVVRNDAQMFEVVFDVGDDSGYAHPMQSVETLNYLMPDGARLYLSEALGPGGFKRISELARADLLQRTKTMEDPPSPDTIHQATELGPGNSDAFAFTRTELLLYFVPAGMADLELEAHVPLAKLRGVLRADWRAPLPSFDCAKAVSGIDKAICADRVVARLDRQVAELYAYSLGATSGTARINALKAAQRGFIAKRNKDCEGLPAAAMGQCLKTAYSARFVALGARQENP